MATLSRPAGFPGAFVETGSPRESSSERWPANGHFFQRGSSQGASPLGLSHGWQIPYDPTQRIQKRPNTIFIEAEAAKWPDP